jgi:ATP-dependent exoDNAse (exonuclease V) alpha subunit
MRLTTGRGWMCAPRTSRACPPTRRAIANIAASRYLVQPLAAPAGAGKTHSLQALRAAAHRAAKDVLVLAPTGKAVDEAMRDQAGDRGLTVAKALQLIEDHQLDSDRRTVMIGIWRPISSSSSRPENISASNEREQTGTRASRPPMD